VAPDDLDLEKEEKRVPRWQPATPPSPHHVTTPPVHARSRVRPWFFVGIGLLFAVLLWICVSQVIAWGAGVLDFIHYGDPRTFQTDAMVGQGDSPQHPSHSIALNLHGQVVIVDFPAGDPSKAREFALSMSLVVLRTC
jgi:hypothetical protein